MTARRSSGLGFALRAGIVVVVAVTVLIVGYFALGIRVAAQAPLVAAAAVALAGVVAAIEAVWSRWGRRRHNHW